MSKITDLADPVFGEISLPGLQMVPSCCVFSWTFLGVYARREKERASASSYKDTNLLDQGPTCMTSLNLDYFL